MKLSPIENKSLRLSGGGEITVTNVVDEGSDGIVCKGHFSDSPNSREVAIKFYVPFLEPSLFSTLHHPRVPLEDLKQHQENERQRLLEFPRHPNLQAYLGRGVLEYDKAYFENFRTALKLGDNVEFVVSSFVDGPSLSDIILSDTASARSILIFLQGVASALQVIHEHEAVHGDVRPSNVKIRNDGITSVLLDFGLAKTFFGRGGKNTSVYKINNAAPPEVISAIESLRKSQSKKAKEKVSSDELRQLIFPFLDLYQFGKMIEEILKSKSSKKFPQYEKQGLSFISAELLKWQLEDPSSPPGHQKTNLMGTIVSVIDLQDRLQRLVSGPAYYHIKFSEEEDRPITILERASGEVAIRKSTQCYLAHPLLRRLQNLKQLALIHNIYSSATQTRFDHTLSCLSRTQDLWKALSEDPHFLLNMSAEDIRLLEFSALHHDLNHFPFLHYFQEAGIKEFENIDLLQFYFDIGNTSKFNYAPTEKVFIQSILDGEIFPSDRPAIQIIKSIINSGIDVDKMAYLIDDAYFTGVPYGGGIDIFGLLRNVGVGQPYKLDKAQEELPTEKRKTDAWHIVFSIEALPAIESLCSARYWNFQRIYWNEKNRALAAMIIWTVRKLYKGTTLASVSDYLKETYEGGEDRALEHLSRRYKEVFNDVSPLDGLSTDPKRIYHTVFQMSFTHDRDILSLMQNQDHGEDYREKKRESVFAVVKKALQEFGYDPKPSEVLLDVPLRIMTLGGEIFIRDYDDSIYPAKEYSLILKALAENFTQMSTVLRIYLSPEIRESIPDFSLFKEQIRREIQHAISPTARKTKNQFS